MQKYIRKYFFTKRDRERWWKIIIDLKVGEIHINWCLGIIHEMLENFPSICLIFLPFWGWWRGHDRHRVVLEVVGKEPSNTIQYHEVSMVMWLCIDIDIINGDDSKISWNSDADTEIKNRDGTSILEVPSVLQILKICIQIFESRTIRLTVRITSQKKICMKY